MSDESLKPEGGCGCGKPQTGSMPQVTFSTFILSLCSSCMVHLGELPDPSTNQDAENLELAKHTIDVLAMLQDKTKQCLDDNEAKLLSEVLYELRMKYVAKTK